MSTMFTATLSQPEPRNVDGLQHFISRTFAALGLAIDHFQTPTFTALGNEGKRLIHLKFSFVLESQDAPFDNHRRTFRLRNDELSFRTRASYAARLMERLNEFANAEAAYYARDKETRGPPKTGIGVDQVRVFPNEPEEGEVDPFYWQVKLLRPRAPPPSRPAEVRVPSFK
jgi:hypothetical protein